MREKALSVAFLSHVASRRAPTGAERSLGLLASGMRRRGHRVAVVVPGEWSLGEELRRADVALERIPARSCWMTYYEPRRWPIAAGKWARYAWPQPARSRIAAFLDRFQADVVHVNCLPHLRGASAACGAGRPVVWHVREILPRGLRRKWFSRKLADHATRVVAVSEAVAGWIREEGLADRLDVVPNGVDAGPPQENGRTARSELGLPAGGIWFGLFGQLVPHKGALPFVEAARRALAQCPDARCVIAGAGPEAFRRQVEEAIRESGYAERIHLLEAQPGGERLIAAVDVVCLATLTPDPLPRAVLEGMAAGKPVVAFRSGGTAEMVEHEETGLLVPSGDAAGLAAAIVRLSDDEPARRAMGRRGAARARERFSIDGHLDAMERIFRSVAR